MLLYFSCYIRTPTPQTYTLSLHDALPISARQRRTESGKRHDWKFCPRGSVRGCFQHHFRAMGKLQPRSEEHTSELQSLRHLVCRLLLEKKKNNEHIQARLVNYALSDAATP